MSLRYSLLATVALVVSAAAQDPPTTNVRGTLHDDNNPMIRGYLIELGSLATHQTIERMEVTPDGEFKAMRVPFGDYSLRVTNYHGDTIAQQYITVNQSFTHIDVRLPERAPTPTGETVSARQLLNPPRRKALDASLAAQRFSESGRYGDAATQYEKALRISPDYAVAHSNLGVQYMRLGRYEEAASEIQRSIEIAGPSAHDLTNLAYAQYQLGRFAESAASAQSALKLQADSSLAQKILLAAQQRMSTR